MNQLQQQYKALEELPTTPEIIERLKGKITDPVTDMWQIININKRLDANEQGINKVYRLLIYITLLVNLSQKFMLIFQQRNNRRQLS